MVDQEVFAKLKRRRGREASDGEEEEEAEAMFALLEERAQRSDASPMVFALVAAKCLARAHDKTRLQARKLIDATDALLAVELDEDK